MLRQGECFMEGIYPVFFGSQQVGKVQVQKQGLYYRFFCRCKLTGDVVCRLMACCGGLQESLGVVVPVEDGFGLEKSVPVKRLGQGPAEFRLVPRHETAVGIFVPLSPEEPFAYIKNLKNAYFERRYGQAGIVIPNMKK